MLPQVNIKQLLIKMVTQLINLLKGGVSMENKGRKNYRLGGVIGLKRPIDGYTREEIYLQRLLVYSTIDSLYRKLPTNRMKSIVAMHFELGYPQQIVAQIFDITQQTLADEIEVIKKILLNAGKRTPKKPKKPLSAQQVERILEMLAHE
jgi:predicted DNA-binding protein YlxM (UPF0122 family)